MKTAGTRSSKNATEVGSKKIVDFRSSFSICRKRSTRCLGGPREPLFRKESPSFYPKIFKEIGADPMNIFVVDDEDDALSAAQRAGAKTVKVGKTSNRRHDFIVDSLSELPQLIA